MWIQGGNMMKVTFAPHPPHYWVENENSVVYCYLCAHIATEEELKTIEKEKIKAKIIQK